MTASFGAPMSVISDIPQRVLPADDQAEQQIIGAVLRKTGLLELVADQVRPNHFAYPVHVQLWELILEDFNSGRTPNVPALNARLASDPTFQDAGGPKYLIDVCAAALPIANIVDAAARRVTDLWLRRETILRLEESVAQLYDTTAGDASSQIENLETDIATLTGDVAGTQEMVTFAAAIDQALSSMETALKADGKLVGVTTGLTDLDRRLGGLHDTDLIILAGRPSMGKSALGQHIAEAAARDGKTVGLWNQEMSNEQTALRSISGASEVPSHRIREGRISTDEAGRAAEAGQRLKSLPIHLNDASGLTIGRLRTEARRLKRRHGLHLIVIDYLQLMQGSNARAGREYNRTQEISDITRGLKALAKELRVPVLALSQLSRQVEQREDKRPQLADLRESGSIEQDADVVMFVFREQYYLERAEPSRRPDESDEKFNSRHDNWQSAVQACWNMAEIIVGKQRHGPVGTDKVYFNGSLTKFGDLETHHG